MVERHDDDSQFAPYWRTLPQVGWLSSICPALPCSALLVRCSSTLSLQGSFGTGLGVNEETLGRGLPQGCMLYTEAVEARQVGTRPKFTLYYLTCSLWTSGCTSVLLDLLCTSVLLHPSIEL